MLGTIKTIFGVVQKIIAVFTVAVSITEAELEDGKSSDKEKKALGIVEKGINELVDKDKVPEWVADIFLTEFLSKYLVTVLVKVAHSIDFFTKKE